MAKNLKYVRTTSDKVTINGILSDDATVITYEEDKESKEANIKEYLEKFAGMAVSFSISTKSEDDLAETDE